MFLSKLSLVLCIFAFGQINAQSYNFPKLNLTVSWTVNKNTTKFTLVHNKTDFSNRWIAVGINTKEEMNGGNALICFFDNSTGNWVGHYHLDGATPKLFDESKPGFGIKNSSVTDLGKEAICTFERENYLDRDRYLDSVQDLFVLAAMSKVKSGYRY
ncbi:hypothetical protein BpHYR1_006080 [Brachionus plicatilis]|uniref:DOMON domain-containing protein n=1 Tax=Brachionus plicatilis TaxID=10195 RepID=A0A3M7RCV6_BRAPC|nr:hypothetical protein BpHYR1_006080 [Brachionus plicatilis]